MIKTACFLYSSALSLSAILAFSASDVFASIPTVPAAKGLTIQDAMSGAYKNNQDLLEKRQSVLAGHEQYVQAAAGWRPKVRLDASVTGSQTINSGDAKNTESFQTSSESTANTRAGGITFSQNLFNGGATVAATEGADKGIRAAWASVRAAEQETLLGSVAAFLDLLSLQTKIKLLEAAEQANKKNLEAAEEKLKIGEETMTQVANAEAKLADITAQLQTTRAELEGAKATFMRLTSIQASSDLTKPDLPKNLPMILENAIQLGLEQNPAVIAAQFEHLAAKAEIDKVAGGLFPQVDFEASSARQESLSHNDYNNINGPVTRSNNYNTNNSIVLKVSVPLYEGGAIRSQKRQAHEVSVQKRIAIEKARNTTREQITQSWQKFQAAKSNIENYQKQVKASEISLEGTKQEMAVGTKILLDVLDAQTALLEAQMKFVEAEKTYFLECFRLLATTGQLNAQFLKLPVDYFNPESHYQMTSERF
ncbi:MAG: TolC family outer membrane protein [Alphaproteobacteria bacterium]|nr:TolC family outer membrane protein [Alphaproteobacteria bacterium]